MTLNLHENLFLLSTDPMQDSTQHLKLHQIRQVAVLDSSQSQYSKALKLSHPHPLKICLLCPVSQPHPSLMSQPLPYHHPHQEIIKQRNHSVSRWVRLLAMQVRQKDLEQPRPQNRVFLLTLERRKVRAWCSLE